jgi:hypothetical protein
MDDGDEDDEEKKRRGYGTYLIWYVRDFQVEGGVCVYYV